MVKAIDFAVRNSAGGVAQGSVAGTTGSNFIKMGVGDEISLNLAQASVVSYVQKGDDLVITLIDGRQIVLDGYFNSVGEPNQLYLSQDGQVIGVEFQPGSNGTLFASYGQASGWDKFSTIDDLRFAAADDLAMSGGAVEDQATMGAFVPGLVGLGGLGAGLAGLGLVAAVAGGGGGGGGGGGPAAPTVDHPESVSTITTNTTDPSLVITGTGEPGDAVTVNVGPEVQTTTIGPDGIWSVTFPPTSLPPDGTYESTAVFTHDGDTTTLDGPGFIIDLTPPSVVITAGALSTHDVENGTEYTDGVSISGTSDDTGATIVVTINGHSQTTTVTSTGTWTVTFPTTQIPPGEYQIGMTVTATDIHGNVTRITDTLVVDTVANPITFDSVTADNVVNLTESGGYQITGTSIAGAVLTVTVGGISQTVTATADGTWSASFAASSITTGEHSATVTATSTDAAGNVNTQTHTFRVDTTTAVAVNVVADNDVVNATEQATGVTLTGTAEAGATVQVTWNGVTVPATVAADGTWSATYSATQITTGSYDSTVTVVSTDAAGNSATTTRTVQVDTETSVSINAGQAGGDDVVNGTEHAGALVLTGRAEAGASVVVTFAGASQTVTASAAGVWSATWAAGSYAAGTYDATVTATATDAAGNTATASRSIHVDTEVVPLDIDTTSTGADDVLNATEAALGLTITGSVEPGSTVMVRLATGTAVAATVAADGSWSAVIPASQIPAGETTAAISVTATDAVGNVGTVSGSVDIDTVVRNFHITGEVAGDGIVNAAEAAAGVTLTGTVEPLSTVVVALSNGTSLSTTATAEGTWTVTFAAGQLPEGTGTATATVTATDPAGNVATLSEGFAFDTVAPEAPALTDILRNAGAVSGVMAQVDDGTVTFHQIASNGSESDIAITSTAPVAGGELFLFGSGVADGSYLVIDSTDAAGNAAATLAIVNNTTTVEVDLNRAGLADFDFASVDLTFAPQANLTITAAQLNALTGVDKELMIKGDADDHVRLDDATATGTTRVVDGHTYDVYDLGTGMVLVDEDIQTQIV